MKKLQIGQQNVNIATTIGIKMTNALIKIFKSHFADNFLLYHAILIKMAITKENYTIRFKVYIEPVKKITQINFRDKLSS